MIQIHRVGTLFDALGRQPSGAGPIETDTGVTLGPSETEAQIVERGLQGAGQSAMRLALASLFAVEGADERADVQLPLHVCSSPMHAPRGPLRSDPAATAGSQRPAGASDDPPYSRLGRGASSDGRCVPDSSSATIIGMPVRNTTRWGGPEPQLGFGHRLILDYSQKLQRLAKFE